MIVAFDCRGTPEGKVDVYVEGDDKQHWLNAIDRGVWGMSVEPRKAMLMGRMLMVAAIQAWLYPLFERRP